MNTLVPERGQVEFTPPYLVTSGNSTSGTRSIFFRPSDHYPAQRLLSRVDDPHYMLRQNILLNIEFTPDGAVLASEPTLNMYGVGETVAEAVDDFASMLVDLYEELEDSREVLSYHLRRQLDRLCDILAPR